MKKPTLQQITFQCSEKTAEPLSALLNDSNALSVTLMDAEDNAIYEPTPGETPLWPTVQVVALFQHQKEIDHFLEFLRAFLEDIPPYVIAPIKERDWIAEVQAQFPPQCFAHRLWVYPEWLEVPKEHEPALRLAPGLAFGTGTHPSTKMCLNYMARFLPPHQTVVDYGCGSGILSVAALILGAEKVYAVDVDPQALEATTYNATLNLFKEKDRLKTYLPESCPPLQADFIIANILLNPLKMLKPVFQSLLKPEGVLVLAGVLNTQAEALINFYNDFVSLTIVEESEGWVCLSTEARSSPWKP